MYDYTLNVQGCLKDRGEQILLYTCQIFPGCLFLYIGTTFAILKSSGTIP